MTITPCPTDLTDVAWHLLDVWLQVPGVLHRLYAIQGLSHDLEVHLPLQNADHASAKQSMRVDNENPYSFHEQHLLGVRGAELLRCTYNPGVSMHEDYA
jgi:hypothetical protein